MSGLRTLSISLALALSCATALAARAADSPRPAYAWTTTEAFDVSRVPAYAGRHDATYARIDADLEAHVAHLQRWVRQRSISAQDDGIDAMAAMVADDLRALGFDEVRQVETLGHPGVLGYYDAGAARTLVVYMMYDVQPVEKNWRIDVLALERASLHLVEPRVTQLAGHQRQGALPVGLCGEAAVTVASAQLFQRPGQIIHRLPPVSWV